MPKVLCSAFFFCSALFAVKLWNDATLVLPSALRCAGGFHSARQQLRLQQLGCDECAARLQEQWCHQQQGWTWAPAH